MVNEAETERRNDKNSGCPGFGSLLVDFGVAVAVTLEVTGRRGRRVAAPPRDSPLAPSSPAQSCSALLIRSRALPRKTTALGRFVHKISRSGAASAASGKALEVGLRVRP